MKTDKKVPTPESMEALAAAAKAGLSVKPPSFRDFWAGLKAIIKG